jgi:hypothetical protein
VATQQIITPHALPLFRQDKPKSVKKQMEKDRLDPVKSHRPELPITAKGVHIHSFVAFFQLLFALFCIVFSCVFSKLFF